MTVNIKTREVPGASTRKFRQKGRSHHHISIYLSSDKESELDEIDSVQYELHPTFKQRLRVSESRSNNFEIRIWTYGYFKIRVKLILVNGAISVINGFVKW